MKTDKKQVVGGGGGRTTYTDISQSDLYDIVRGVYMESYENIDAGETFVLGALRQRGIAWLYTANSKKVVLQKP